MPQGEGWDVPDEVRGDLEFRWFRVAGNRVLILLCLADSPVWYRGHFVKGRMLPCLGQGCKMCSEGVGAQLRYVLPCAERFTHRTGLIEFGHSVAVEVRDLGVRRGGMRGLVFEVSKHSYSKQSRMEVAAVADEAEPWWREVDYPDPKAALYFGWQKSGFDVPEFCPSGQVSLKIDEFRRPECLGVRG